MRLRSRLRAETGPARGWPARANAIPRSFQTSPPATAIDMRCGSRRTRRRARRPRARLGQQVAGSSLHGLDDAEAGEELEVQADAQQPARVGEVAALVDDVAGQRAPVEPRLVAADQRAPDTTDETPAPGRPHRPQPPGAPRPARPAVRRAGDRARPSRRSSQTNRLPAAARDRQAVVAQPQLDARPAGRTDGRTCTGRRRRSRSRAPARRAVPTPMRRPEEVALRAQREHEPRALADLDLAQRSRREQTPPARSGRRSQPGNRLGRERSVDAGERQRDVELGPCAPPRVTSTRTYATLSRARSSRGSARLDRSIQARGAPPRRSAGDRGRTARSHIRAGPPRIAAARRRRRAAPPSRRRQAPSTGEPARALAAAR